MERTKFRAATLGLLVALGLGIARPAAAPLPGLGPDNPRQRVDMAVDPWRSLVRVQAPGLSRCTGFLVARDRVVTAAHCLFNRRLGRFIPAGSVHVLLAYSAGDFAAHRGITAYRTADGYDPRQPDATLPADIAVLTLATPVSAPPLALDEAPHDDARALGGYNQDRAEVIEADLACVASGGAHGLIAHGCTGTRGSSGAPLLSRGRDGTWRVAGVHVASWTDRAGGLAVPSAYLRALLAPR